MEIFTFTLIYFFVWLANFCLEIVEWSGVTKKIGLLINFSSQNTYLFGVKSSDNHNLMRRAAYRLSAVTNFDAINRCQFFLARCCRHEKLAVESGMEFMVLISGSGFWSVYTRL